MCNHPESLSQWAHERARKYGSDARYYDRFVSAKLRVWLVRERVLEHRGSDELCLWLWPKASRRFA